MKKLIGLFLIFLSIPAFGQTETETIKQANDLIANKKYESAFKLLDDFDHNNNKPDVVLLKEDIVLNYFVSSVMHQIFALKDLENNENIIDYRGKTGSYNMYSFAVDSILNDLIKIYPTNCNLYKGLGEFYYEAYSKYGRKWLKSDSELFQLIQSNLQKAIEGNCSDYKSNYALGYINLIQKKYKECIPYFLQSIEIKKDNADAHYNLAYAYLFTDDRENALKYAKNSFDLYTDQEYKSEAARMIGQIYTELNDDKSALTYYELADNTAPGNYDNIKALLRLYIKLGDDKAQETTKSFFKLAPDNPTIYNDLREIYFRNNKVNELIDFYKSQFSEFKNDEIIQGNLNFYLGQIYIETDKKTAKEYLLKAQNIFSKIFEKNHQVFEVISEGLKQCE